MKIKAVAVQTFKEALRMKILFLVAVLSAVLILVSPLLPSMDVGVRKPLFLNISFALSYITALAVTVALSVVQVPREIEKRTIFNVISKPISRSEFVTGKLLGVFITVALTLAILFVEIFSLVLIYFKTADLGIFYVMLADLAEMSVIASFAVLISLFFSPLVNGSFCLLAFFVFHAKGLQLQKIASSSPFPTKLVALVLYYLLPNLENFNLSDLVAHGVPIKPLNFAALLLYGIVFALAFLALSCVLFARKEIG